MRLTRLLESTIALLVLTLLAMPWLPELAAQDSSDKSPPRNTTRDDDRPIAFRGAKIHVVSGPVIARGVLIVHRGKIVAIGAEDKIKLPMNAIIRDVTGKVIIPGLVDTHSHIGIFPRPRVPANSDGNEMTGPTQPGLRAIDAIFPDDPGFKMARAGGITTANIMPGSGNAIGGATLYVKFRSGIIEFMRIITSRILGGIKFANGENPKGAYGGKGAAPGTRMKIAALQREQLVKARDYQARWKR
ncbi:MAG TPA: amidohydrolase, partial [Gemmataceae bacterium]|nr:amidohydrolase [Gemmataceae bacterium]